MADGVPPSPTWFEIVLPWACNNLLIDWLSTYEVKVDLFVKIQFIYRIYQVGYDGMKGL